MIYLLINNIVSAMLIFLAYKVGLINGQKISNNQKIELVPDIEKIKEEKRVKKKQEEVINKYNTILSNIDAYDGTADGQKDIEI